MSTLAPVRTDQRMEALAEANRIRFARAQLKRDVKETPARLVVELVDPPDWLLSMRVLVFLRMLPYWGAVRVKKLLREFRVSESATVGGLTDRQRKVLAEVLLERIK